MCFQGTVLHFWYPFNSPCPASSSLSTCYRHCAYQNLLLDTDVLSSLPLKQAAGSQPCPKAWHFFVPWLYTLWLYSKYCCGPSACGEPWLLLASLHSSSVFFPYVLCSPLLQIFSSCCMYKAAALCNPKPWHKLQITTTLLLATDKFPEEM